VIHPQHLEEGGGSAPSENLHNFFLHTQRLDQEPDNAAWFISAHDCSFNYKKSARSAQYPHLM
jgi:hypothetical protein